MTRAARSPGEALRLRAARDGNAPLLTWYGADGARTELSAASFENWVAKTVNLLADADVDPGAVVRLDVLRDHPAHWMALVWPFAAWDAGASVDLTASAPDLVVTGPAGASPATDAPGFACSLDAWARPLAAPPAGLADFTGEALAQPDASWPQPLTGAAPAWTDAGGVLTADALLEVAPQPDRVLLHPRDARASVALLLGAILAGGSAVLVEQTDAAALALTATAERARLLA